MDEILREHAKELDRMISDGSYAGFYSALGFLAIFAQEVISYDRSL